MCLLIFKKMCNLQRRMNTATTPVMTELAFSLSVAYININKN